MMRLSFSLFVLVLCVACATAFGQTTAQVTGTISDSTGAVIPGAEITVVNLETGTERTVTSNEVGSYTVPLLPPGNYRIVVTSTGFRQVTRDDVRLEVNQVARVDFQLEVGEITETIEVTGAPPLLESDTSAVGQVIEETAVNELPLNGRNFVQLAILGPGVVGTGFGPTGTIQGGSRPDDLRPGSELFSNGNREGANNFMIDGVDNNDKITLSINVRPSVEAVREFKIQTNMFAADQGRNSGATVNVITKSGSNEFHGSVYEFLRNSELDAKQFFDSPDEPIPAFRQNQFGASGGGPIVRNKLFFFANYEGFRKRRATTEVSTVPTAAMRQGDFGEVRDIFDPFSVRPAEGTASGFTRDIFPNRIIPESRFDNVTPKLFFGVPLPDSPGLSSNLRTAPKEEQDWNQGMGRIDWSVGNNDQVFGRFSRQDTDTIKPSTFPEADIPGIDRPVALGSERSFAGTSALDSTNAVINWTHTFSPTFLAEGKVGFSRFDLLYLQEGAEEGAKLGEQLGVPNANQGPFSDGIPIFFPSGYQEIGQTRSLPIIRIQNAFDYDANFTHISGKHTRKFGFKAIRRQASIVQTNRGNGRFNFNRNFTRDPNNTANTGDSIASVLLGTPSVIQQDFALVFPGYRATEWGLYLQDDWRVSDRLTLNLGVRYELFGRYTETGNRIANFDPTTGTHLIAGFNSDEFVGVERDGNNIAPRFGFAYRLSEKTVVRGGYGIFYNANGNGSVYLRLHRQLPFGPVNAPEVDEFDANPARVQDGLPPIPPLDFEGVVANPTGGLLTVPSNFVNGYVQQYNFGVQHSLDSIQTVVKATYIGNLGRRLDTSFNLNQPFPGPGAPGPRRPLRDIAPNVTGVTFNATDGLSNYNALQLTAERRFRQGLGFLAAYTWGHSIDNVPNNFGGAANGPLPQDVRNRNADRASSGFDIRQRLTTSINYELPFGRGKRFGSDSSGVMNQIIGGWQTNLIFTAQDGLPFTPALQSSVSNAGGSRPDLLGNPRLDDPDPALWFNTSFNQPGAVFGEPEIFTFGNAGRNILTGPGRVNFDFSIFKEFPIRETAKLQFRAEFFNLFNTPQFALPNASIGSPNAGIISGIVGNSREIQFSLRFAF